MTKFYFDKPGQTEYGNRIHITNLGGYFARGDTKCGLDDRLIVPPQPDAPLCPKCYPKPR